MAWPASQQLMADSFKKANQFAINVHRHAVGLKTRSLAGPVNRLLVINLYDGLSDAIDLWNETKVISGIAVYAKEQFDDPSLDVATEINSMINAAITLRDWIYNNFPKDSVSDAIAARVLNPTGGTTELEFTTSQLAGLITEIDIFVATIS